MARGRDTISKTREGDDRHRRAHRWGVGLPLATGRFGLPFPLAPPLPTKHRLVVGQPLLSGPPCAAPSKEAVLELYGRWCAELLRRLFTAHAHEVLPKAVAARGRARLDCSADCEGHFRAGTQRAASAGRFGPQTGSVEASWADKPSISTYMCMCMCMCMCISLHAKSSTKIRFIFYTSPSCTQSLSTREPVRLSTREKFRSICPRSIVRGGQTRNALHVEARCFPRDGGAVGPLRRGALCPPRYATYGLQASTG